MDGILTHIPSQCKWPVTELRSVQVLSNFWRFTCDMCIGFLQMSIGLRLSRLADVVCVQLVLGQVGLWCIIKPKLWWLLSPWTTANSSSPWTDIPYHHWKKWDVILSSFRTSADTTQLFHGLMAGIDITSSLRWPLVEWGYSPEDATKHPSDCINRH